jgi:sorbitol/mannitol transport system substrate-binding protein
MPVARGDHIGRTRKEPALNRSRILLTVLAALTTGSTALAQTKITIATVNNGDMIIMQKLSREFEKAHPEIKLDWVVLEENVLRERVTTDIATKGGSFDVMTIGTYETPIWGKKGWLVRIDDDLPASYDLDDVLKPIRDGLSADGKVFALPFYGESSFTFYRKDLFQKAGVTMPEKPTYQEIEKFAKATTDRKNGVSGMCLRGKPGWGENMAYLDTLVNTFGGRWFDEKWHPQLKSPEWKSALTFYIDMMKKYGPPGASSNGHNENRALFATGHCAMWIDATVAAGYLANPKESKVASSVAFAPAPIAKTPNGSAWLWSWALGIPASSKHVKEAKQFIQWATSKEYVQLVAKSDGWTSVPPGTRKSTYDSPEYKAAAPFAELTLKAILSADPTHPTAMPVPYTGVQFVAIPEFQSLGTQVGQVVAAALVGKSTVDQALDAAQSATERTMKRAGYIK